MGAYRLVYGRNFWATILLQKLVDCRIVDWEAVGKKIKKKKSIRIIT